MSIFNKSNTMWEAVIESTEPKRSLDLVYVINSFIFTKIFIRMNHFIDIILLKLPVFLLKIIGVVEKLEH
jgi:hypothetical protein